MISSSSLGWAIIIFLRLRPAQLHTALRTSALITAVSPTVRRALAGGFIDGIAHPIATVATVVMAVGGAFSFFTPSIAAGVGQTVGRANVWIFAAAGFTGLITADGIAAVLRATALVFVTLRLTVLISTAVLATILKATVGVFAALGLALPIAAGFLATVVLAAVGVFAALGLTLPIAAGRLATVLRAIIGVLVGTTHPVTAAPGAVFLPGTVRIVTVDQAITLVIKAIFTPRLSLQHAFADFLSFHGRAVHVGTHKLCLFLGGHRLASRHTLAIVMLAGIIDLLAEAVQRRILRLQFNEEDVRQLCTIRETRTVFLFQEAPALGVIVDELNDEIGKRTDNRTANGRQILCDSEHLRGCGIDDTPDRVSALHDPQALHQAVGVVILFEVEPQATRGV